MPLRRSFTYFSSYYLIQFQHTFIIYRFSDIHIAFLMIAAHMPCFTFSYCILSFQIRLSLLRHFYQISPLAFFTRHIDIALSSFRHHTGKSQSLSLCLQNTSSKSIILVPPFLRLNAQSFLFLKSLLYDELSDWQKYLLHNIISLTLLFTHKPLHTEMIFLPRHYIYIAHFISLHI